MTTACRQGFFGQRKTPHTVIIARGESVRHFIVKPWMLAMAVATTVATAAGGTCGILYLGGETEGSYFGSLDNAKLAEAYELRIASLRSEVDRLTTRGFLDREKVSSKVEILLDQQADLAKRYAKLQPLLDRARASGLIDPPVPVPEPSPATGGEGASMDGGGPLAFGESEKRKALDRFQLIDRSATTVRSTDKGAAISAELIQRIGHSIDEAETNQIEGLDLLTSRARAKSAAIGDVLRTEGVGRLVLPPSAAGNEGGPYVPVPPERQFDAGLLELATALDALQGARDASRALPLAAPVASTTISSTFGLRSDPFLGKAAMHTGIDFVAESGTAVKATAPGKVVFAGESAGYGQMVEIDHGNGLSTRYAHLSRIAVGVGDTLALGATVGSVGSTGRSTGPHLHYEVRHTGEAIDPARYLKAGRRINALG